MLNKSSTLSKIHMKSLDESIGPSCSLLTAGIAKIHSKLIEEYSFKYTKLFGILCLILDRSNRTIYLKMFNPKSSEVVFSMRVKRSFIDCYKSLSPFAIYFNYKNIGIGFSFSDSDDVGNFEICLSQYLKQSLNLSSSIVTGKIHTYTQTRLTRKYSPIRSHSS